MPHGLKLLTNPTLLAALALRALVLALMLSVLRPWANPFGDLQYYYAIAQQAGLGQYPFIHYWMEYPPLFPVLLVGIFHLLSALQSFEPTVFFTVFVGFMSLVDVVNLVLVYELARRAHGQRAARTASFTYAVAPTVVWFTTGWFDALAVCLLLSGLLAIQARRSELAGTLAALGFLVKLFPALLVVAAPIVLDRRAAAKMVSAMVVFSGVLLLPFLLIRPDLLGATVASISSRAPWETVWALSQGLYAPGRVAPLAERGSAVTALGQQGASSGWLPLGALLALGLVVLAAHVLLARQGGRSARDSYLIVALATTVLLLGNKGFSPQFSAWLVPLLLLVWPNRTGVFYVLLWTGYFLFYYLLFLPNLNDFIRMGIDPPEQIRQLAWISVLARTAILGWTTVHLTRLILTRAAVVPVRGRVAGSLAST